MKASLNIQQFGLCGAFLVFVLLLPFPTSGQHRAGPPPPPPPPLPPNGPYNQPYPIQNIFGNFFRPGGPPPPQQFAGNGPLNNANPTGSGPSRSPAPPTGPGAASPPPLPPPQQQQQQQQPPPPPPPGKRRPPPQPQAPRPRSIAVRPGPPRGPPSRSPRPNSPPPPQLSGRNKLPPPPPPPPQLPPHVLPDGGLQLPNVGEVITLTSNFGEEPEVSFETTTRREADASPPTTSTPTTATEFVSAINFDFDGDQQQQQQHEDHHHHHHHHDDGLYPPFTEEEGLTSNDLASAAPSETQQQPELPFKLTPRGHSAPVIISQVPVKSFQSSNQHGQVVKEPMPETENRRAETATNYFEGDDLTSSGSQVSEQYYQGSGDDHGHHDHPEPAIQRDEAKAATSSSNFYFRANPETAPTAAPDEEDLKSVRKNRLLTHDHHHDHHGNHSRSVGNIISLTDKEDSAEAKEAAEEKARIEEEVRGLVDCGGRDLGFCDMSSKYPGHMMGNLMSDCQELVYRGFAPVPEDLDELGDSEPVAKYSNSSKSAVRAQTGSWSWKPYAFKKKQVCDSELRFIRPGYARDATGKWQVIVQTEDLPQRVAIDLCHSPEKPCRLMSDCGQKSKCVQRYNFQHLLAVDPDNLHDCPTIRAFKFPSACVCHIEYTDYF